MDVKVRDWTFTHWWVRPVVKVWFDIYHKSVSYSGKESIKWEKPIIFAPSHQNAFSDALCLILPAGYTNNKFIYPLIRADAFGNSRIVDWVLTTFHMLPVYRPRDEVDLKRKNRSVFSNCYEILEKKRNLLIHPEGNCIPRKRVRRFKKGLARIALGAEEENEFNLGVEIIPVGINYRDITRPRKGIHVRFGSPVEVSKYRARYEEHASRAIYELTRKVEEEVKKITIDIDEDDYELTDKLLKVAKNLDNDLAENSDFTLKELAAEKQLIGNLNKTRNDDIQSMNSVRKLFNEVEAELENYNLDIDKPLCDSVSWNRLGWEGAGYLLLFPPALYGWFNNIVPWFLMKKTSKKIEDEQFKSSAAMVAGLLLFPLSYLLQSAVFIWGTGNLLYTLGYLLSLPLSGLLALNYCEKLGNRIQYYRLKMMPGKAAQKIRGLFEELFLAIQN